MLSPTRPPAAGAPVDPESLLRLVRDWAPERLLALGSGPIPVHGATAGALALDGSGDTVLVLALGTVTSGTAAEIGDELDRLAQMAPRDLRRAEPQPPPEDPIQDRHFNLFGSREPFNRRQHAILLVEEEPTPEAWGTLSAELGARLRGVFRSDHSGVTSLPPPEAVRPPQLHGGRFSLHT
ncbi:MAG: hypothetical protein M3P18_06800, partial [Actinomycetota bacterium]|nr:hypothetical protein [Actinomycetota bacterium]